MEISLKSKEMHERFKMAQEDPKTITLVFRGTKCKWIPTKKMRKSEFDTLTSIMDSWYRNAYEIVEKHNETMKLDNRRLRIKYNTLVDAANDFYAEYSTMYEVLHEIFEINIEMREFYAPLLQFHDLPTDFGEENHQMNTRLPVQRRLEF